MIDDEGLRRALAANEQLFELCNWPNERNNFETASGLIPIMDETIRVL
jgi:hypothetical protein